MSKHSTNRIDYYNSLLYNILTTESCEVNNRLINYDVKENGKRLRELRGDRPMREIADGTGISLSLYGMYERGERNPSDDNKLILARFYGMSVDELFYRADTTD